jgi:hypothetical protein
MTAFRSNRTRTPLICFSLAKLPQLEDVKKAEEQERQERIQEIEQKKGGGTAGDQWVPRF